MGKENKPTKFRIILSPRHGQRGTVIVYVAIVIIVLIGFAALAVDIAHLYVARNELQDAADAGALAGAGRLYVGNGTAIDPNANQFAYNAAVANTSQNLSVEVNCNLAANTGDVQRGHWSFTTRQFTPNARTTVALNWMTQNFDTIDTDADPNTQLINAVRVITRRESTPVAMTFARIFGFPTYPVRAEAVAYIGFAGSINPHAVDQPLAICRQSITDSNGVYSCVTGREINSGGGGGGHNTSAWSNFSQPCTTANPPTTNPLICAQGNPLPIIFGLDMGTTNGMVDSVYKNLYDCWRNNSALDTDGDGIPDKAWPWTLPVIDCGPNLMVGNCMEVVGVVEINVLWMEKWGTGQIDYPTKMEGWTCTGTGSQCWTPFATYFQIEDWNNIQVPAPAAKSIYFQPDCKYHEPTGNTGGPSFGILAKIPVLVAPP